MDEMSTDRMRIDARPTNPLQLLRGRIRNLRKKRCRQNFLYTQADIERQDRLSIFAALAGDSASASQFGLASISMSSKEEADFVEFDLEGKYVKAWISIFPFEENDEVEVVAEPEDYFWRGYGIRRTSDRTVVLYPHCGSGRNLHYKDSIMVAKISVSIFVGIPLLIISYLYIKYSSMHGNPDFFIGAAVAAGIGVLLSVLLSIPRSNGMKFARLSEKIFEAFGWENPRDICMATITQKNRPPGEPARDWRIYRK